MSKPTQSPSAASAASTPTPTIVRRIGPPKYVYGQDASGAWYVETLGDGWQPVDASSRAHRLAVAEIAAESRRTVERMGGHAGFCVGLSCTCGFSGALASSVLVLS